MAGSASPRVRAPGRHPVGRLPPLYLPLLLPFRVRRRT